MSHLVKKGYLTAVSVGTYGEIELRAPIVRRKKRKFLE